MRWLRCIRLVVVDDARDLLAQAGLKAFDNFMSFAGGRRVCHKRGRSTFRLQIGERAFYLKRNRFDWVEFFKRLSRLRLPVRGALCEWHNIALVQQTGVPTVVPIAYGERLFCGIEICSFSMTEELYGCNPLDQVLLRNFSNGLSSEQRQRKRDLLRRIGALTRQLHGNDLFHQDFYLSHFFISAEDKLYLIDLQRILHRPVRAGHFRIKDLGQLNFSINRLSQFSRTDRMRILLSYLDRPSLTDKDKRLVCAVLKKTRRIAKHDVKLLARRRCRGELP